MCNVVVSVTTAVLQDYALPCMYLGLLSPLPMATVVGTPVASISISQPPASVYIYRVGVSDLYGA